MDDRELELLVAVSRVHNATVGITGMLLYLDGNFIQVLEGSHTEVVRLYDRIRSDPRHLGIMTLVQGNVSKRAFPDWSMGYQRLSRTSGQAAEAFDLTRAGLAERLPPDIPPDVGRLISSFVTVNGRGTAH